MDHRKKKKAFTLTELIVVIAILGLLMSAVGVAVFNWIAKGEKARIQSDFHAIDMAVKGYYMDVRKSPNSLRDLIQKPAGVENWNGPYLDEESVPLDPWNNPYKYKKLSGRKYELISYGADGKAGGQEEDQDYSSLEMKKQQQ